MKKATKQQKTQKKQNQQPATRNQQTVRKRGFTLIEILVVSTIIIVVSAIGLVSYSSAQVNARDAKRAKDLENVRTVLLLFRTENGYYPIAEAPGDNRIAFSFPRRVVARLASAFIVPNAQAALDLGIGFDDEKDDSSLLPIEEDDVRRTPTPTPPIFEPGIPTVMPTATPPVIKDPPPTQPKEATAYQTMATTLIQAGYMQSQQLPVDPVNNGTYYYGYSSSGSSFELTARMEKDSSVLTLTD